MPRTRLAIPGVPDDVVAGLRALQDKLDLPQEFPADVVAEAEALAANPPAFPDHVDLTAIEFLTIDPVGSMDLDQALHIERDGDGYLVRYAIADVPAWIAPGSALDRETHERGETLYAPSAKVPLHPKALSEGAASLLADGVARPALVWEHAVAADGQVKSTTLQRAMVVNRDKLDYAGVQAEIDGGSPREVLALLKEVGLLRQKVEAERGGISLNLPEQEIVEAGGTWHLVFRALLPVEDWNAQVSLMTGIAAAKLMLAGKVGIVRTLPPAEDFAVARLRRQARTLGVDWPVGMSYPDFVRSLDPRDPKELAVLVKCTFLFRGAGYASFDGRVPSGNVEHSALATPYAHTTAPLRRLVDRYVLEICHSLANNLPIADWARQALGALPEEMAESGRRANAYERGVLNLTEALVMADRVGETFEAVLTDVNPKNGQGTIQIADPAVEAAFKADPKDVGERIRVRLVSVDKVQGTLKFARVHD